eukprot:TRINITY_DN23059_c0_g1_i1.p3 TRINITY_DN23059_c0_g1~~TRINITY_DN23059_c0_g1_i1.p3  ORF type:complete len:354 (-),score=165.02 TRINITY_DN23059_c0_g1_i1:126-1187(-)
MGRLSGVRAEALAAKKRQEAAERKKKRRAEKEAAGIATAGDDDSSSDEPQPPPKKAARKAAAPADGAAAATQEQPAVPKKADAAAAKATAKKKKPPKAATKEPEPAGDDGAAEAALARKLLEDTAGDDEKAAEKKASKKEKKEKPDKRHEAKSGTVFVSGFPKTCNVDELKLFFAECGEIEEFKVPMCDTRNGTRKEVPRGFAIITFRTQKGMKRALGRNQKTFEEKPLKVIVHKDKTESEKTDKKKKKPGDGLTIFIKNLPHQTTDEQLKAFFKQFGKLGGWRIPRSDGWSKGIAFVKFTKKESVDKAMEKTSLKFEGRTIELEISADKTKGGEWKEKRPAAEGEDDDDDSE